MLSMVEIVDILILISEQNGGLELSLILTPLVSVGAALTKFSPETGCSTNFFFIVKFKK